MKAKKSFKSKLLRYFLFAVIYYALTVITDVVLGHKIDWLGALYISVILSLVVTSIIDLLDKK